LQVGNALIDLQQAKAAYQAAAETRRFQAQALDVEQARFDEGVDTALQLIHYERDLAQAESSEVSALGVYAKAKAALERAVRLTLKNNNVNLDEAYEGRLSNSTSASPIH
jgi:outer membrane protein